MQAQMEMGALLNHLRVAPHGQIDLVRALVDHCAALERHHELSVSIEAPPSLRMPERSARELLRIAREALHNVVKHSGGAAARLRLAQPSGTIVIEVRDDGRGFEQSEAHEGMGLNSMAERAEALGGTLELWSVPGHGTTVRVRIPTPAEEVPYNG
jgi:signal transduction histidine kinase